MWVEQLYKHAGSAQQVVYGTVVLEASDTLSIRKHAKNLGLRE